MVGARDSYATAAPFLQGSHEKPDSTLFRSAGSNNPTTYASNVQLRSACPTAPANEATNASNRARSTTREVMTPRETANPTNTTFVTR